VTAFVARAPGKVFLTGEYVVLRGAPALVAAVDRYVTIRLEVGPGALAIESVAEDRRESVTEAELARVGTGDVGAVLAALRTVGFVGGRLTVDSRDGLLAGRKLGLGRSAATLAAATAVLLAAGGERARPRVRAAALAANADFQDGHGSGGDVAASVHGGVVEVRREKGELVVSPVTLPDELQLVVGWTGESAPTVPLVARFATAESSPTLSELGTIAEAAAAAASAGDADALCAAVAGSAVLLARLGEELGLPIVTPALRRLVDVAARVGAAAKPSGAGAGDCGIALVRSSQDAQRLHAAWQKAGITPLPVMLATEGVTVE
jgi:phosphomevalonate kinase